MAVLAPAQIDIVEYRLRLSRALRPPEAAQLRGFFGQRYTGEELLHNHRPDGGFRYDYPRVQYKILDRNAYLIGLAEGAPLMTRLWMEVERTRIGLEELPVLEATLARRREVLGESGALITYRFLSPWLGLNQENHQAYERAGDPAGRRALLERILVGNCLSLAKAMSHQVRARLRADASGLRPVSASLKGVPMLGFVGTFAINFLLPNRLGIGKSVSRGFGTVERVGG
jgi:hypothetical protein